MLERQKPKIIVEFSLNASHRPRFQLAVQSDRHKQRGVSTFDQVPDLLSIVALGCILHPEASTKIAAPMYTDSGANTGRGDPGSHNVPENGVSAEPA